jgi:hypothetical protein
VHARYEVNQNLLGTLYFCEGRPHVGKKTMFAGAISEVQMFQLPSALCIS